MRDEGLVESLGRTITGYHVKTRDTVPRVQLFFLFEDGTYVEVYSSTQLSVSKGVSVGNMDDIRRYMSSKNTEFFDREIEIDRSDDTALEEIRLFSHMLNERSERMTARLAQYNSASRDRMKTELAELDTIRALYQQHFSSFIVGAD